MVDEHDKSAHKPLLAPLFQRWDSLYRELVELFPHKIFIKDRESVYLYCSENYARDLGMRPEEIVGKTDFDLHPHELAERYREFDRRIISEGVSSSAEMPYAMAGKLSWSHVTKAPLRDESGAIVGVIGLFDDITALKSSQLALTEEKAFTDALIESLPGVFYLFDENRRFIRWNRNQEELTGLSSEQMRQTPALGTIYEQDRPLIARKIEEVFATGYAEAEARLLNSNGAARQHFFTGKLIEIGGKRFVAGMGVDISERVRAEEALKMSERCQKAILDNIPDIAWLKDIDSNYIMVNSAVGKAFSLAPDEFPGKSDRDFFPVEMAALYRKDDLEVISTGKGKRVIEPWQGKDGKQVWIETIKAPIFNQAGEVIGTTGIARDITERKLADDKLRLLAKVFESSSEAIVITDAGNHIITVNAAFTQLTGYTPEEVLGRNPGMLSAGHESKEFFRDMWHAINEIGHWQGEIWDRRKDGGLYPKWLTIDVLHDEYQAITHYIGAFSDISERKVTEERIRHLAQHDILTGLPNRILFSDRLEQAIANASRHQKRLALLFIDLDHFKNINDSMGHHYGDLLLQEMARRLQSLLRESDVVCRQGGDEFILILQDIRTAEEVAHIAEKLVSSLSLPVQLKDNEVTISSSIGIALYPEDGNDEQTLISNADVAMYHAKQSGRSQYQFFVKSLNEAVHERLAIENGLRKALLNHEFVLHYQPQIDLASGTVIGAEALIRWNHPEQGLIMPGRFIAIAEDSCLIVPIGDWVLKEACRQAVIWHKEGLSSLVVAVNLSAVQFKRGDLEQSVASALAESGLEPAFLELELTESILIQDTDKMLGILQRLKALGIRFSIDDFGTGYSSLAYLKRFAVDKLKIDQSFIRDMTENQNDAAIVRAIIQMARSLYLKTIAEGVEFEHQLTSLHLQQCDEVQGYHFARPMPAGEFSRYLAGK